MAKEVRRRVQTSWTGRLGGSLKGIGFGLVLILLSGWILFWNEGRAVRRYQALVEGQETVVPIRSDKIDPTNNGSLVHVSGEATTEEFLADHQFGIQTKALRLKRMVEMWQWFESATTRTEEQAGGESESVTTYTYSPRWSAELIDSSRFKDPTGHSNPNAFPVTARSLSTRQATLGAFRLPDSIVHRIDRFEALELRDLSQLEGELRWRARLSDGGVFLGRNPARPQIGDVRIRFEHVPPLSISLIARQVGDSFEPYLTSSGERLELLRIGIASHESMFQGAQRGNRLNSWLLRLLGVLIMYLGVAKVLKPAVIAAAPIPVVGDAVASGTRLISLLAAGVVSLVVISLGWIYYRPLLAAAILATAAVAAVFFLILLRKSTSR